MLARAQVRELDGHLRRLWKLGANMLIRWRYHREGLEVFHLTSYGLPAAVKKCAWLIDGSRLLTDDGRIAAATAAGCERSTIRLGFILAEDNGTKQLIDELLGKYSVIYVDCRAVALYDMVSFSLHSPFEQVTQVNVLSHFINLAGERIRALGLPVDICMTTTGDGFYAWNDRTGLMADVGLYCATMLALGYVYAVRPRADPRTVPRLRACVHFGSHYEYKMMRGGGSEPAPFIVGDVTITLARLISKALTHQLLVGTYTRRLEGIDAEWGEKFGMPIMETPAFVALAQQELAKIKGTAIPGGEITSVRSYLTGPRVDERSFTIRKYLVSDKHGLEHACYNAKFNLTTKEGGEVRFGLLESDMAEFKARHDPADDIMIRVV